VEPQTIGATVVDLNPDVPQAFVVRTRTLPPVPLQSTVMLAVP
jgi:hypothetical protein